MRWTAPDGTVYERVGSCEPERCGGQCCTFMTFGPFHADTDAQKWAELHDGVTCMRPDTAPDYMFVNIQGRCSALTEKGLCSLYDTSERPQACSDWPRSPVDLMMTPDCGYSFKPVEAK